jgi:hypothetical protein
MTRVCLDTVITSGRVLEDLDSPEEMAAVRAITQLSTDGRIKMVTTEVSRIEERRTTNAAKRSALEARWNEVSVVQPPPVPLGFNILDDDESLSFISSPILSDIDQTLLAALRGIGLAQMDASAVVYAVTTKCDYFVTFDSNDLLPHKVAIEKICPQIKVVTPTEFIAAFACHVPTTS